MNKSDNSKCKKWNNLVKNLVKYAVEADEFGFVISTTWTNLDFYVIIEKINMLKQSLNSDNVNWNIICYLTNIALAADLAVERIKLIFQKKLAQK